MITALLVDDSVFMRKLLKSIIEKHHYKVVGEADNGQAAVEKYKKLKPDVVFMDVMMNKMNGIKALKHMLEYDSKAKVVMASSMMAQDPFIDDAMSLGALAVINKPFVEEEVADVILRISPLFTLAENDNLNKQE